MSLIPAHGVYVIDPRSKVIMHMYDDRGLDMIAAELETLRHCFNISAIG